MEKPPESEKSEQITEGAIEGNQGESEGELAKILEKNRLEREMVAMFEGPDGRLHWRLKSAYVLDPEKRKEREKEEEEDASWL